MIKSLVIRNLGKRFCQRSLSDSLYRVENPLDTFRQRSRRFEFEYPGTNVKQVATYLRGDYPGWNTHFMPSLEINRWQRYAMFQRVCEKALFAQDPHDYTPQCLGFNEMSREPCVILKIGSQKPTEFVLYHDLCEMWKRRQTMDVEYVNVGSYVEVKMRSRFDFTRSTTYRGLVVEKEHNNLSAYFVVKQNLDGGHCIEKFVQMYSPWLESVKMLSYQVRDDKLGKLTCLRDLSYNQASIPATFPEPEFDDVDNVEIPHFVPLQLEFRTDTRQQRRHQHSKHLLPRRNDTLRMHKMWETDPDERYTRPNIKNKRSRK